MAATLPIVLHAGFHKTGTSTVQQTLRANRAALKPHCALRLKPQMRDLLHACRSYATWPDPVGMAKLEMRAEAWVATLPACTHRALVISAEELCGHMPGRERIDSYAAAVPILTTIARALTQRYEDPQLRIVLTTRAPDDWLQSAYWEHVKSSDITLSLDAFTARYAPAADFDAIVAALARDLAPRPVTALPIEDHADAPAAPILRLAGVPDAVIAGLARAPRANTRLPLPVLQELLDLNRRIDDREARRRAKQALVAAQQPGPAP